MPFDGRPVRMVHVPGHLFSVNPKTVPGVPGLFARNKRVVCLFQSASAPFVMVLDGATIVGSIATVWHGVVNPVREGVVRDWRYDEQDVTLRLGQEMGRFLLGSTVILLFPKDVLHLREDWVPARTVRMGRPWPAGRGRPGLDTKDTSISRLVGAVMLEQDDEWSLNRRYMQFEGLQTLSDTVPTRLSTVAR